MHFYCIYHIGHVARKSVFIACEYSTFVICLLQSIISLLASCKTSKLLTTRPIMAIYIISSQADRLRLTLQTLSFLSNLGLHHFPHYHLFSF